ncbi:hypothetical protein MiYa_01043 [Microcystis aeruginosa NIES-2519]|uniref:Uncharacterized protein n=1 Tax=Microcystis aeruginosa NIES-2519 TaxID=2303981 RepID=A0A5A5R8L6_MICAE|nr:hypothetical protein MiYa_01043 [Microcystis aeruginosa NIES-2519]GCA82503.1 hypothetical protein MiHa_00454 [Microcystis aeruginosa NIES-2522]
MSQKDNQVYVEHMIDTANKALSFVEGVSREVFEMTFNNNHDNF